MELIKFESLNEEKKTVLSSELYKFLELRESNYSQWCKTNVIENKFAVVEDDYNLFIVNDEKVQTIGHRPKQEFELSIDFAKKLCMVSNSLKGNEIRNYFIDVEKRFLKVKETITSEFTPIEYAKQMVELSNRLLASEIQKIEQQKVIEQQQIKIEDDKPKVDFYDQVTDSKTALDMAGVAKTLNIEGIGRNNLFGMLRRKKILQKDNLPYQWVIDRGYMRVIEQKYTKPNGDICISLKTVVFQKGVDYIHKILTENNLILFEKEN